MLHPMEKYLLINGLIVCAIAMTPEEAKQHLAQLDEVLSKTGQEAIYSLGFWLKSLGLKLSVNVYQLNPSKLDSETPVLQELLSNPKKEG